MTPAHAAGCAIWVLLIAWAWLGARVSRNRKRRASIKPEKMTGTGPAWVQDTPYDEIFEEEDY